MEIYLGNPGEKFTAWCKANYGGSSAETVFYFKDGTSEKHLVTGALDPNKMEELGYYDTAEQSWLKNIINVEIGTAVTVLESELFAGNINLAAISIPNSVTEIGWYTFNYCTKLTSITLPASIETIGTDAFNGCSNLTIHVPNALIKTKVEQSGFNGSIVLD